MDYSKKYNDGAKTNAETHEKEKYLEGSLVYSHSYVPQATCEIYVHPRKPNIVYLF
jgi:hypothetical protein